MKFEERLNLIINEKSKSVDSGIQEPAQILACGQSDCKSFKSKEFEIEDIFDKGPLWLKDFLESPEVENEVIRIADEIKNFIDSVECEEGCEKKDYRNARIIIEPVGVIDDKSCSGGAGSSVISGRGESRGADTGGCIVAGVRAFNDFKKKLKDFINSVCGEECSYSVSLSEFFYAEEILQGNRCQVDLEANVNVVCSEGEKITGNKYKLWFEADVCVECLACGTTDRTEECPYPV